MNVRHVAITARPRPWRSRMLAAVSVVALTLGAAGCAGKAPESADDAGASGALRVGIFVDNAFGDGDFMDQGAKAVEPLKKDKGATVHTYEGQLQAQNFGPMLQDAAKANDVVFVLGFEAIDALIKAAKENPKTTFVFVDGVVDSPDVASVQFRTAEGCFMAGALAATVSRAHQSKAAGFIGGANAPVVENCQSGYEQGVAKVDPAMKVASQYVGSFTDPSKGREITISLENRGAYAIFAYAGLSGAGAFDAAKSGQKVAPIGVVADKSSLAPGKVPGSLEMGVDSVIMKTVEAYQAGTLKRGATQSYGFAEGGWTMVYNDKLVTDEQRAALKSLQQKLSDGSLKVKA